MRLPYFLLAIFFIGGKALPAAGELPLQDLVSDTLLKVTLTCCCTNARLLVLIGYIIVRNSLLEILTLFYF